MPTHAPRIPHPVTLHGVTLEDDYFWLRDKSDPQGRGVSRGGGCLRAGGAGFHLAISRRASTRRCWRASRKPTCRSPIARDGTGTTRAPRRGSSTPSSRASSAALTSAEEIVLDLNVLARDHAYFAIDAFAVSDDGDFLAYSVDTTGFREYTLRIKDLRRDQDGPESIERVSSVAWAADGRTLFYVTDDDAKRAYRLWRRRRGEDGRDPPPRGTGRAILADDPALAEPRLSVLGRRQPHGERGPVPRGPRAPRRFPRLPPPRARARIRDRARTRCVLDPHQRSRPQLPPRTLPRRCDREGRRGRRSSRTATRVFLAGIEPFAEHLVAYEREDGLERYIVHALGDGTSHAIAFPEPAYSTVPDINAEFETRTFRFRYQSMVTPPSIYDYDMATRDADADEAPRGPGRLRPVAATGSSASTRPRPTEHGSPCRSPRGTTRRATGPLRCTSSDTARTGTRFPSPSRRTGCRSSIEAPSARSPTCAAAASWESPGTTPAGWRTSPTRSPTSSRRPTSWCSERYASRERLIVEGGSAGGLLVGAVLNMAPEVAGGGDPQGPVRGRGQHHARCVAAVDRRGVRGVGQPRRRRAVRPSPRLLPVHESRAAGRILRCS